MDNSYTIQHIRNIFEKKAELGNYELLENQFRISIAGYCAKRIYHDKKQLLEPLDISLETHGIFNVGHAFHQYIEQELDKTFLIASEFPVNYAYKSILVTGHPDLLVLDDKGLKVVDIKTTNDKSFSYKLRDEHPSIHHKIQANMYGAILQTLRSSVLYVNTKNFAMCEKEFLTDPVLFYQTCEKFVQVYQAIQNNTEPVCQVHQNWEMDYCPYRHHNICGC